MAAESPVLVPPALKGRTDPAYHIPVHKLAVDSMLEYDETLNSESVQKAGMSRVESISPSQKAWRTPSPSRPLMTLLAFPQY